MIAIIHRGQKFKETMEAFQQKRAEFIAQEIRNFDTETLYVFVGKDAKKIQEYIQNQLKEDLEYDQMTLKEYVDTFTGEPVKQSK